MHRYFLIVFLSVCLLALPGTLLAAAPASVTGISATAQPDGSIRVQWRAVDGTDIAAYRVYFSRTSILGNQGEYDDFETTEGPVTEMILTEFDHSLSSIALAVLAVNMAGEESPFFVEEAMVPLTVQSSSMSSEFSSSSEASSEASASSEAAPVVGTLHLLVARADSATRVTLEFSDIPKVDPQTAAMNFAIRDPLGTLLPVEQITPEGSLLALQTAQQSAGTVYEVRVSDPLQSETGLPLDTVDRTAFFSGHATGLTAQPTSGTGSLEISQLSLTAAPERSGRFTVSAQWEVTGTPAWIVVRQSRDGGRTFGQPETLSGAVLGAQIPGVTPQEYGLAVYAVDAQGKPSRGMFQSIDPATGRISRGEPAVQEQTSVPPTGQVIARPQPPTRNPLSQTGAGIGMLALAAFGAVFGWQKLRKNPAPAL